MGKNAKIKPKLSQLILVWLKVMQFLNLKSVSG